MTNNESNETAYETLERRYNLAVNLESWELLAMHSVSNEESIPRIRLRMLKAFAGLPTEHLHYVRPVAEQPRQPQQSEQQRQQQQRTLPPPFTYAQAAGARASPSPSSSSSSAMAGPSSSWQPPSGGWDIS